MLRRAHLVCLAAACGVILMSSCDRERIRVYTAPKDNPEPPPETPDNQPAPPAAPRITYSLPAGWQASAPSGMSIANFRITTDAGEATVNVTPLAGLEGRDVAIVNLWRQQVGQAPLADEEVNGALAAVEIAGEPGKLFEITGQREGQATRIVTAFVHRPGASWFYKLQGSDAVVTAQKSAFVEFLKSVQIQEGVIADRETAGETPATRRFAWVIPQGWQTLRPGQMQVAKFSVPPRGEAKAEVFVSVFPADTGGVLANVNRWRKQLGLEDIDEAGLKQCVSPLSVVPNAVLVDLTNGERRLVGAIVPRDGRWWFYKLMGDAPAVDAERSSFVTFVSSPP